MKKYLMSYIAAATLMVSPGCKKDNYTQPSSQLTGKVVYQGEQLGVRSNGVQLELWQHGYGLFTKIPVYVDQDGSFSAIVFDGSYKLVRMSGSGPWANNTDSIDVKVSGSTSVDVPVDPYFIIKSASFQRTGNDITATFTVQAVNTSRALEAARLFIGSTTIIDQNNNLVWSEKGAADVPLNTPVTLKATIPAGWTAKDFLFARIGVKTIGVPELVYSTPQSMGLK